MRARAGTCLIIAAVLVLGVPALAQGQMDAYIQVHFDEVDPAGSAGYEANAQEWVEAFTEADLGSEYEWNAYNSDFVYAWVSPMPNWAFLDGQDARNAAAEAAIGEEKMKSLLAGGSAGISHYTEVWKFEPELTYLPEGFDPGVMAAVNVGIQWVKLGSDSDFRDVVKDAIAAISKVGADMNFMGYKIAMGSGSYGFVSFGESRSALHGGPEIGPVLAEALGPEGAQELFQRWVGSVLKVEDRDWRARPDLSYVPGDGGGEMAGEGYGDEDMADEDDDE